ncbi:9071_t:CDS:2, partial [Funneliformis geosporum]
MHVGLAGEEDPYSLCTVGALTKIDPSIVAQSQTESSTTTPP